MDSQYKVIENRVRNEKIQSMCISHCISYAVITSITAPLTTLGVLLQVTSKPLEKFYETTTTEITKLELAKSHDLAVKERRFNELQLSSGQVGTNKPFRAPYYANYRQALLAVSAQGYQGFFKGNFVEICRMSVLIFPKFLIMFQPSYQELPGLMKLATLFTVDIASELATQPLQNGHTRFILQNRLPQFRVYRSLYKLLSTVSLHELMQGYNVILPRKLLFYIAVLGGSGDFQMNVWWTFFTYTALYPLDTVQRRLEAQSTEHSMLPRRFVGNFRWALSRIYNEEGIRQGLYRGYICNMLANTSKLFLYPIMATMFWYRSQENDFISSGLDLVN
jgi:hypothetical protein